MKNLDSLNPFEQLLDLDKGNRARALFGSSDSEPEPGVEGKLTLRLGTWNLMFALDEVAELVPVPRITRVPGVKSWLLGIANLRGAVVSVIDLLKLLSGKPTVTTSNSRIVILRSGEWYYGLLVDDIIGMRHFGVESKLPTLNAVDPNIRPYLAEAFRSEEKEWLVFNVNRLLTAPTFLGSAS